ncbi:lysine 2,3-aminomutase, partial [Myxococcota bacterium]|nr:lysine 2,3-aminomutase [Myxococcota bacterium]
MKISEFSKWKDVSTEDWNDWQWQLRNRLRTLDDFDSLIHLTSAEREAFEPASSLFPAAATPYYALLMDADDPACPVRRQIMPSNDELIILPDELRDPLGEETYSPVPGLTHRYKDRALFYISHHCAHYCRHCNRRRKVGDAKSAPERSEVQAAMDYLREHDEIRDVLVSGGDPLSLSDKRLDEILGELRTISHI